MSKEELKTQLNDCNSKLNEINYKLNNLDEWIRIYKEKEKHCISLSINHLSMSTILLILSILSSFINFLLIPCLLFSASSIFLFNTIKCLKARKKFNKFNKYLSSKHFTLALAKFVMENKHLSLLTEFKNKENEAQIYYTKNLFDDEPTKQDSIETSSNQLNL